MLRGMDATELSLALAGVLSPDRQHTAIVISGLYQPAGGAGRTVMPPTYPVSERESDPSAKYQTGPRLPE